MKTLPGVALAATALSLLVPAPASAGVPGGTQAPSAPAAGGAEYGVAVRLAPRVRPTLDLLRVAGTIVAGRPPRMAFRVQERGVGTVNVSVAVVSLQTGRTALVARMGWVHVGRVDEVLWPAGATLQPGSYRLTVNVHDHHRVGLLRNAHSSGVTTLTVRPAPSPKPAPPPSPPPPAEAGVPTPAQTVAAGSAFPVTGPHDFGGAEDRYGAAREGHVHQGQDVLAAEGTPIVAPLAGTISWVSYQAGGAGYYVVEHTALGLDLMFAHCRAGSVAVAAETSVTPGQALCAVGQTGDATGPHLHFEMWVGGWQAAGGHPIDPLPYLQAWEAAG